MAVKTAEKLGVPQNEGIALFAEIKSEWSVNHNKEYSGAYKPFVTVIKFDISFSGNIN